MYLVYQTNGLRKCRRNKEIYHKYSIPFGVYVVSVGNSINMLQVPPVKHEYDSNFVQIYKKILDIMNSFDLAFKCASLLRVLTQDNTPYWALQRVKKSLLHRVQSLISSEGAKIRN